MFLILHLLIVFTLPEEESNGTGGLVNQSGGGSSSSGSGGSSSGGSSSGGSSSGGSSSGSSSKKKLGMSGGKRKRIRYVSKKFKVAKAKKGGEGEEEGKESSGIKFNDAPGGKKTLEVGGHKMCHKEEGGNDVGDCDDGNKNKNGDGWKVKELNDGIVLMSEDDEGKEVCLSKEKEGEMKMEECKEPAYKHQKFEMSDYAGGGNDGEDYDEFETLEAVEEDEDDSSLTEEENEKAKEEKKNENAERKAAKEASGGKQNNDQGNNGNQNGEPQNGSKRNPFDKNSKNPNGPEPAIKSSNHPNSFAGPLRGPDKSHKNKDSPQRPNQPGNGPNNIQRPDAPLDPNKLTEPPGLTPPEKFMYETLKNNARKSDENLKKFLKSPELKVDPSIKNISDKEIKDSMSRKQSEPPLKICCANTNGCRYEMRLVCNSKPLCC